MCWFLGVSATTASYTGRLHWLGSQTRVMTSPGKKDNYPVKIKVGKTTKFSIELT